MDQPLDIVGGLDMDEMDIICQSIVSDQNSIKTMKIARKIDYEIHSNPLPIPLENGSFKGNPPGH